MDRQRMRYLLLESYVNGNAPLPELSRDTETAWRDFQAESRTNFGLLIRDAVCDRIVMSGLTVGGSVRSRAAKALEQIAINNRIEQVIREFAKFGTTFGSSYLTVWNDDDGSAVITADSPLTMIAAVDPLQPWQIRAALRVWRDLDEGRDYALVWADKMKQRFSRACYSDANQTLLVPYASGGWEADTDAVETGVAPPVVVYHNADGMGEFEPHIDIINRINRAVLNQVTTFAMQAFRQRALQIQDKDHPGLPQKDQQGNAIDWAKLFEPHPAALWNLPPGVSVWESQSTDTAPMLAAVKDYIRHLSAVSKTPLPMLVPDSANQTAAGAENAEKSFIFKCTQRVNAVKLAIESALLIALQVEGFDKVDRVEAAFEDPARVMLSEKYAAAMSARATGLSLTTIQRLILGMSPDEIEQDAADRALEAAKAPAAAVDPAVDDAEDTGPVSDKRLPEQDASAA
ncbi:hypothetical protein A5622_07745 [Mycobacterium sp. 1245801.1]|nr:hypothetical protein A5622_07745 [Mycobacterium sp. 1245801.1]